MDGFGKRIKHYRNLRGLTQEELGSKVGGVSKSFISKLENEKVDPSLEMLNKIASVLKVDVGDLLSDKYKIEPPEDAKEDGLKWILIGKELEKEGISPEQVRQWAKIATSYDPKKNQ
ncbi:helix-turn-helix transcriptional regulator [Bacillus sp. RO3]|nr:helix-turn-helix transcriptional regulator [Bacillus sp. RO3]